MALTDEQRTTIVAEAEEMREQLVAMFDKQRQLFAKLGTLPPRGPMVSADNSVVCARLKPTQTLIQCNTPTLSRDPHPDADPAPAPEHTLDPNAPSLLPDQSVAFQAACDVIAML
jgi:hypothetical protein